MTWARGQSGNPHGRPKSGRAFAEALRAVGEEGGNLEAVAEKVWELARGGDLRAIQLIAERLDGRPLNYEEIREARADEAWENGDPLLL
jgi:hypothetical protein